MVATSNGTSTHLHPTQVSSCDCADASGLPCPNPAMWRVELRRDGADLRGEAPVDYYCRDCLGHRLERVVTAPGERAIVELLDSAA